MVSYAGNREDVMLRRLFPEGTSGFYIDVGAGHPLQFSVTKHFYDRGWRGINVEPAPRQFAELNKDRTEDLNLNVALSDAEGTVAFYEFPPEYAGWATVSKEEAMRHLTEDGVSFTERRVPVTTLAAVCEKHVTGDIDFLSVDVEGLERQVLQGADFTRWRPRVCVIEATVPATNIPTHDKWEHLLLDADYKFAYFDGLNRFYVRAEDPDLLSKFDTPVSCLDEYEPYEYLWQMKYYSRQLAASRVLREDSDQAAAAAAAAQNELRIQLQQMQTRLDEALATPVHRAGDPGPLAVAVARRLSGAAQRLPRIAGTFRIALRLAMKVKRKFLTPG
ncbi:FkbM family methyltransferase [soil metagenome]